MSNLTNNAPRPQFQIGGQIRILSSGELAIVKALTADSVIAVIEGLEDNLAFNPAEVESALTDLICSTCHTIMGAISAPAPSVPIRCQTCRRDPGCASWCPRGDGHRDELFDADRICYGDGPSVPLTIEPSPGLGTIASIEVSPVRRPGGRDSVYLNATQRHGDTDMDLTVGEARQLAAVLLQVADVVDVD